MNNTSERPEAGAAASPPARLPRRVPKKVIALAMMAALVFGGWYYLNAPDLPPGALMPDVGAALSAVTSNLPVVGSAGRAANAPPPGDTAFRKASREARQAAVASDPAEQAEAQIRQALTSTGLPISAVDLTTTAGGKSVLVVGLDASNLTEGVAFDAGLAGGVEGVVKLAKSKSLNLSAAEHVVIAVADGQGRPLFGIAAPSSAITQFREGKIDQREFLRATAIKAESRAALLDAVRQMAGR